MKGSFYQHLIISMITLLILSKIISHTKSNSLTKQSVPQVHYAWNLIVQIQQIQNRIPAARSKKIQNSL